MADDQQQEPSIPPSVEYDKAVWLIGFVSQESLLRELGFTDNAIDRIFGRVQRYAEIDHFTRIVTEEEVAGGIDSGKRELTLVGSSVAMEQSGMTIKRGLAPVLDENSRVLILGTLPGDESLRQQRYYSDPSNLFWSLMSGAFVAPVGRSYAERLEFLADRGVALWDVLQSAERTGSSDSAITKPQPNEFGDLFAKYSDLRRVAFNGTKAEALWRRHIGKRTEVPHESLTTKVLPSSSGTPGFHVLPYDEKLVRWKAFLRT